MDVSLKLIKDLPLVDVVVAADDVQLVAVIDNVRTVRVPVSNLTTITTFTVTDPPSTPTATGVVNGASVDTTGLYTYSTDGWGKTPRLQAYWEDLTSESRFLLCNAQQSLLPEQQETARRNLDIGTATTDKLGLVRLTSDMEENDGSVPTAAVVKAYIDARLESITATNATLDLGDYSGPINLKTADGRTVLYSDDNNKIRVGNKYTELEVNSSNAMSVIVGTQIVTLTDSLY